MVPDEIDYMREEEKRATGNALTIILKQFQHTGDVNQALEDIFHIIEEG